MAVDEAARGEMRELDARVLTHEGARAGDRGDDDDAAVLGGPKERGALRGVHAKNARADSSKHAREKACPSSL